MIAIGSHGNLKHKTDRDIFLAGFGVVIQLLQPSAVVVYGSALEKYFQKYPDSKIRGGFIPFYPGGKKK